MIKAGSDSRAVLQRFEHERQALALMDHPNIARVYDGGLTPSGQPFFVMELVSGQSLTRFCDAAKLTLRERLELFVPICQAVQHAHQKGIVHRDLKPTNVLVTEVDGRPTPKIIDFGVAKATAGKLTEESLNTQIGAVIGTLEYMSPEQAGLANMDVDTRSDVYSLGVILYELLTGLRPLEASRLKKAVLTEMIRVIQEEEPSKPSTRLSTHDSLASLAALRQTEPSSLMATLRGELDWIVMKCLEKQRDRRYETANGLARDIQRFLADEPVEARAPSAGYRLRKFVRRNRIQVVAVGLLLASMVVGVVGTSIGLVQARTESRARQQALLEEQRQRRKAEENEARAEAAYARVADVLDTMTSELTERALLSQGSVTEEQRRFLDEALSYYREFSTTAAEGEEARRRVAVAAYRVGVIEMRLHRDQESANGFRMAARLFGALADDFPEKRPLYLQSQAMNHNNLGLVLAGLGKSDEAFASFSKSREILESLIAEDPRNASLQRDLVALQANLSSHKPAGASEAAGSDPLREVVATQEKLVAEFPDVPQYRHDLARTRSNRAIGFLQEGRHESVEAECRDILEMQRRLVNDFPREPEYRQCLARTYQILASSLAACRRPSEAAEVYQTAREIQRKLVADYPAVPQYRQELAMTQLNLGNELINQMRISEGEELYRDAVALLQEIVKSFPHESLYRQQLESACRNLAIILSATNRSAEAEEFSRRAEDLKTAN